MRKIIELPAPTVSQLKKVDIDLEMTGKHYMELATLKGQLPEDIALSILKDLMKEDAGKLTLAELRYLFTLVKINSMEDKYVVDLQCTHEVNGKKCGAVNEVKVSLSEADLTRAPRHYKVPEINFVVDGVEKTYRVMPPEMTMESAILNYLVVDKQIDYEAISNDKQSAFIFSCIRALAHLIDKDGVRVIKDVSDVENYEKFMTENKYSTMQKLLKYCLEVDSFGIRIKDHEVKCKECGGILTFRLPLLYGLTM